MENVATKWRECGRNMGEFAKMVIHHCSIAFVGYFFMLVSCWIIMEHLPPIYWKTPPRWMAYDPRDLGQQSIKRCLKLKGNPRWPWQVAKAYSLEQNIGTRVLSLVQVPRVSRILGWEKNEPCKQSFRGNRRDQTPHCTAHSVLRVAWKLLMNPWRSVIHINDYTFLLVFRRVE